MNPLIDGFGDTTQSSLDVSCPSLQAVCLAWMITNNGNPRGNLILCCGLYGLFLLNEMAKSLASTIAFEDLGD